MTEFTGERVIPGRVDADLMNEHVARYRFAARFAEGARVLDAGCGTGYGTAELAGAASVVGIDISDEGLACARERFSRPEVRFVRGACEALPFADASFDLVTAFEVIEHLERWGDLPSEARRVLKDSGIFLVSTPNKTYYAEMRGKAGPNPFHTHEFEYPEFQEALTGVFPHVRVWTQNHVEAIVFSPPDTAGAALDATANRRPEEAHFFVAACSMSPIVSEEVFAWLPSSTNVLRERERHIAKLEGELASKDEWLKDLKGRHGALHDEHKRTLADLKEKVRWAEQLNGVIQTRDKRIAELQTDLESVQKHFTARQAELEADLAARTAWARSLEATLAERTEHVLIQAREIEDYIARLADQGSQLEELAVLRGKLELIAQSRWIQLGRKLNVGPAVNHE